MLSRDSADFAFSEAATSLSDIVSLPALLANLSRRGGSAIRAKLQPASYALPIFGVRPTKVFSHQVFFKRYLQKIH
jgi:hypothetical protein